LRAALLGLAAVVLAACAAPGTSGPSGPTTLDSLSGFQPKIGSTVDLKTAAAATPANPAAARDALRQGGFSAGTERVFIKGDEFVTVLAFAFSTDIDAGQFIAFERSALTSTPAAALYDDQAIPGSFGFDLAGGTRSGNRTVFCQGVWFVARANAYQVTDCAGSPRYPDLAESVALRQYRAAS
jgi:hypothetical protein